MYDALNVLMAMEIITKEKKNILWRGLPTNTQQEGTRMQMDLASRKERLDKKRLHLQELLTQQISFKNLIKRNSASAANGNGAASSSVEGKVEGDRIPLPFIIVNSRKETVIDCEMAEDKQEIFFNFSAPFEIHDDNEVLKRMQMQFCPALSDLGTMVPESLVPFATAWQQQQQQVPTTPRAPRRPSPTLISPPHHARFARSSSSKRSSCKRSHKRSRPRLPRRMANRRCPPPYPPPRPEPLAGPRPRIPHPPCGRWNACLHVGGARALCCAHTRTRPRPDHMTSRGPRRRPVPPPLTPTPHPRRTYVHGDGTAGPRCGPDASQTPP